MSKDSNIQKADSSKNPPVKNKGDNSLAPQLDEVVGLQAAQSAMNNPLEASPKSLRSAQRAYGNQRVQRAVKRHGGGANRSVQRAMQVNEPDDQFEQEADSVASSLQLSRSESADDNDGSGNPQQASAKAPAISLPVQTSLTVSEPGDPLEREAESVADALDNRSAHVPPIATGGNSGDAPDANRAASGADLLKSQESVVSGRPRVHRSVPTQLHGRVFNGSVQRDDSEQAEEGDLPASAAAPQMVPPAAIDSGNGVQRSTDLGMDSSGNVDQHVEQSINRKRGGGEPLSQPVQNQMEGHLGSDFSDVRVHNDSESDSLNRSLQADAFTTGSDVFFRQGKYEPGSGGGQKLLAHELTHVVQQGAAPAKATQRQEAEEDELALSASEEALDVDDNLSAIAPPAPTTAPSRPVNTAPVARHPAVPSSIMRFVTPAVSHATNGILIQRKDDEKEKERAKVEKQKREGKEKASQKKGEKQGKKEEKQGKANKNKAATAGAPPQKLTTIPAPKIKSKQPEQPEQRGKVGGDSVEAPAADGVDLGIYGWPATKEMALPDWDDEVAKYEAFKSGDMEGVGADLSGLEGHFVALNEPITVDDPDIKAQIVSDALGGGLNGDSVGFFDQGLATVLDSIPFAGQLASFSSFFSGPGEWFESTGEGFKNAAADIEGGFKGMGEGSGWNRAASFLELVIGLLSMINNILQVISVIALIVSIVMAIIYGIGMALAATLFFAAAGASMMAFSLPYLIIAAKIMAIIAIFMVHSNLLIRVLREVVIAFRIIDILYYESDPQKLMERQALLAGHVSGLNSAAYENITPGIKEEGEGEEDEDDPIADPEVSDPNIQRVNRMSEDEQVDYRADWAKRYGIDTTATQARQQIMNQDVPPPPLAPEYTEEQEQDVIDRINKNAIAIVELQRQQYGLGKQRAKADQAIATTKNQEEIIGNAQAGVQQDIQASDKHQEDVDVKLDKQGQLKGKTTETAKKGEEGQGQSAEASGLAGVILALLSPFMPAMSKAGEKVDEDQKAQTKDGADKAVTGADATTAAATQGAAEADDRKQKTTQTKGAAKQTHDELGALDSSLGEQKELAEEGRLQLEEMQAEIASTEEMVAAEKERLIMERTQAVNDAVSWMSEWRDARQQVMEDLQTQLDAIKPEEEEKDEEAELGEEEDKWDIYDEDEDRKLKGHYLSEEMAETGEYAEESEEEGFALEEE